MNYNRVVCFDLEMCCWNENGVGTTGEIIEIGLAEIDLAAEKSSSARSTLSNRKKMKSRCFAPNLLGSHRAKSKSRVGL